MESNFRMLFIDVIWLPYKIWTQFLRRYWAEMFRFFTSVFLGMVQIISPKKGLAILLQHSEICTALVSRYLVEIFDVLIFKWRNSCRFY